MFSLSVKSLRIRNNFCAFALIAAVLMVSAVSASAKELIVYTALENEQINKYLASFKEQNKDVDVKIVRDSTEQQLPVCWCLKTEDLLNPMLPRGLTEWKKCLKTATILPHG